MQQDGQQEADRRANKGSARRRTKGKGGLSTGTSGSQRGKRGSKQQRGGERVPREHHTAQQLEAL
eukprot:2797255-Rhodomonas_salina.2